jgi:putative DeoR family transcriptional regulator (stage III sporulation protein D)
MALYMVKKKCTIRQLAKVFGISKSSAYTRVTKVLEEADTELYEKVKRVLNKNKKERARRGGEATRQKYLKIKNFI